MFHPRRDAWHEHFLWKNNRVAGVSPTGRDTVELLKMNCQFAKKSGFTVGTRQMLESAKVQRISGLVINRNANGLQLRSSCARGFSDARIANAPNFDHLGRLAYRRARPRAVDCVEHSAGRSSFRRIKNPRIFPPSIL
jgi:hypothetical protein